MSTREQEMASLQERIKEAREAHKPTDRMIGQLFGMRMRQLHEERQMEQMQEARDANGINEIKLSCSVVIRHASFIGVEAENMVRCRYPELCMDELNEAAGVLQRALVRIERAKEILLSKTLQAAE